MNPKRLRLSTILGIGLFAALTLLASTQTWWTVAIPDSSVAVAGTVAAPALSALSLSGLALAAALAIAGPVFRLVLGILQLVLAATVLLSTALSIAHPVDSAESLISKATGVAGTHSIHALVTGVTSTAWPWFAIAFGVLSLLAGLFELVTFRLWPVASRKYQAVRFAPEDGERDAVVDWDSLSDGNDPTR